MTISKKHAFWKSDNEKKGSGILGNRKENISRANSRKKEENLAGYEEKRRGCTQGGKK